MRIFCHCGREITGTTKYLGYQIVQYNKFGKIIYATCFHGHVVIDERANIANGRTSEENSLSSGC